MNTERPDGFTRLVRAAGNSVDGFRAAFVNEQAFRLEVYLLVILAPLGFWLGQNGIERVLLVGSLLLVLITELVNSSVEAIVDRIGTEHHELSGRAKDVASATVFVAIGQVFLVWGLVLLG